MQKIYLISTTIIMCSSIPLLLSNQLLIVLNNSKKITINSICLLDMLINEKISISRKVS